MPSLLDEIRGQLLVAVDSMDLAVASRHSNGDQRFCDMTSNQAIVYSEAVKSERADILKAACDAAKATGLDVELQTADALDLLNVLLAREVFPYLSGRVLVQTSPAHAYNTEATIAHAKRLVALFEAHGIPKDRVCIKIPATPESIVACQYLEKTGIRTLSTCLFNLPQALAASQAGCLCISPYFNELRVHFEPGIWKAYEDTIREHPGIPVIRNIVETYKAIGSRTLVMPASIVTATEAVALASLNPDRLTLSAAVLDQLAAAESGSFKIPKYKSSDPSIPSQSTVDYLADGARALRDALEADVETSRKLAYALQTFGEMEERTRELIRMQLSSV